MNSISKIALGGGCHWCTEAVYQSLKGVLKVEQGFVSSFEENNSFSEAVIVHFEEDTISLEKLIEIHLHTHKSTSNHSMRTKYRSAVYVFSGDEIINVEMILENLQSQFNNKIITKVLKFQDFKPSREQITNYFYNNPTKPFCETFIQPKINLLVENYRNDVNLEKLEQAIS